MKLLLSRALIFIGLLLVCRLNTANAQFLMDMVDTTKHVGKGLLSVYKKYNYLNIGGYIQPQYQVIQTKGAKTYSGPDFNPNVDNRFMLRRGRLRMEYARFSEANLPIVQFVFQFDGTERGFFARDFWGRVFDNKFQLFSLTAGMFARPFGYEVNLGSSDRESPERGRMSQILMKIERDLGAMVSFEPRNRSGAMKYFKWDLGFFNGQGLTNTIGDFDSYKDLISRAGLKPFPVAKNLYLSTAVSYFNGGFMQATKYVNTMGNKNGQAVFVTDSAESNVGGKAPRKYNGADAQLKWQRKKGATELRLEYWQGTQTATASTSETPAELLYVPYYVRKFRGGFIYLLHQFNQHHQVGAKIDWYDPNTDIKGKQIGVLDSKTGPADIQYNTIGFGYINYINDNLKLVLWYDVVTNESTIVPGYESDLKDNVFTCRLQFRF